MRMLLRQAGPVVPIVYVDASLNQAHTANLLKKLRKFNYTFAKGIAVVCSVQNCMPVQVDKIHQQISRIRHQHNIPVYSFLLDNCTPESYYMASNADEIYTLSSTIFEFERNETRLLWDGFLERFKLKKFVVKSSPHLSGGNIDRFTSANTSHIGNRKLSHISQQLYSESIQERFRVSALKDAQQLAQLKSTVPKTIPQQLLGQDALKLGLVDKIGQHYEVLREKYPDCHLEVIKYIEQPKSVKKGLAILTSPILLGLFILKVIIKWSLIIYIWIKSKGQKKSKTIEEARAEVEAANN